MAARPVEASGTFIAAPNRVDVIHDTKRNLIYISSQDSVLRYDVAKGTLLTPIQLSGDLSGMDISPDGDTLAVANRTADSTAQTKSFFLVDLTTDTAHIVAFPKGDAEGGIWSVAYSSSGKLLITSRYNGSGWVPLRSYDPTTGEIVEIPTSPAIGICQDSMLCASGDRSMIGIAESNISDGRWNTYKVSDGTLVQRQGYTDGTGWYNYEIGVNSDGTQYALPTYGGTFIYNASYEKVAIIGVYAGGQPIGVLSSYRTEDLFSLG